MDEMPNLNRHLAGLLAMVSEDTARKRGAIVVKAAQTGAAQSSGLRLMLERLAREQIDAVVPQLAAAGDHARSRGAPPAAVDSVIDGALRGVINALVMELQAGTSPVRDYGARPNVIESELRRAQDMLADYRTGYLGNRPATGNAAAFTVSITGSPGANVNQGGHQVTQASNVTIDASAALTSAEELAIAVANVSVDHAGQQEAEADLLALRAQLKRQQPNRSLLQELGRSLRSVLEGAMSDALSAGAIQAAARLWSALGL